MPFQNITGSEIAILISLFYLTAGLGFNISAWLQAAEIASDSNEPIPSFFSRSTVIFIFIWWILAIYCYRAEVKKTIPKIDFDELANKKANKRDG